MNTNIVSIDSKDLITINSNEDLINKWLKFAEISDNSKETYIKGVCKFVVFVRENDIVACPHPFLLALLSPLGLNN